MKVKVWSDYVCPYCFRSEKDFMSIAKNYGDDIELEVMSYELNPNLKQNNPRFTHDAHRLYHYAKTEGKGMDFYVAVQAAHFEDGEAVGDPDLLRQIAKAKGLDMNKVEEVLASDQFAEEVRQEHQAAEEKQIQFVPHFVFPSGASIEGDLSPAQIRSAIENEFAAEVEAADEDYDE